MIPNNIFSFTKTTNHNFTAHENDERDNVNGERERGTKERETDLVVSAFYTSLFVDFLDQLQTAPYFLTTWRPPCILTLKLRTPAMPFPRDRSRLTNRYIVHVFFVAVAVAVAARATGGKSTCRLASLYARLPFGPQLYRRFITIRSSADNVLVIKKR